MNKIYKSILIIFKNYFLRKKIKFLTVIILLHGLFNSNLNAQITADSPYPIIFIHGLNSDDDTWDTTLDYLDDIWGEFKDESKHYNIIPNQKDHVYHAVLNAQISTNIWGSDGIEGTKDDDALISFVNEDNFLLDGNLFAINFENYWNEDENNPQIEHYSNMSPGDFHSDGNESAIFKQGYALGKMIKRVLLITGAEKVILVGHSMGGLAAREYLQRMDWEKNPPLHMWWVEPENTLDGHRVAKLVTIGTPHLGSNAFTPGIPPFPNPFSEAMRDLQHYFGEAEERGSYLFGGIEDANLLVTKLRFHNADFDCDGDANDVIIGINEWSNGKEGTKDNPKMLLPENVLYTWITSRNTFTGDGAVKLERQWLFDSIYNPSPTKNNIADTLLTYKIHHHETKDYKTIIRGLDEPDSKELAYKIKVGQKIAGFITMQPYNASQDIDYYKIAIDEPGVYSFHATPPPLKMISSGMAVYIYDDSKKEIDDFIVPLINNTEKIKFKNSGTYFIKVVGDAFPDSWEKPYTILISKPLALNAGLEIVANDASSNVRISFEHEHADALQKSSITFIQIDNKHYNSNDLYQFAEGNRYYLDVPISGLKPFEKYDIIIEVKHNDDVRKTFGENQLYLIHDFDNDPSLSNASWAQPYIRYSLFESVPEGGFLVFEWSDYKQYQPTARVNRAQMAKLITLARFKLGYDIDTSTNNGVFQDVPENHPYFLYIQALKNGGVIHGEGNAGIIFSPDDNVTRGEMAKFICNGFGIPPAAQNEIDSHPMVTNGDLAGYDPNLLPYVIKLLNTEVINANYLDYVVFNSEGEPPPPRERIVSGTSETTYNPNGDVNRAEMAKFIVNGYFYGVEHPPALMPGFAGGSTTANSKSGIQSVESTMSPDQQTLGNNFEQQANNIGNPPDHLKLPGGGISTTIKDNEPLVIAHSNNIDSDGDKLFFYWAVDDGELTENNQDYQSVTFTPPTVNSPKDVHLYSLAGDGNGNTTSDLFTITVNPAGSASGSITVLYPTNSSEILQKGQNYTIRWRSNNLTGNVKIWLYKNNDPVDRLAESTDNDGSFDWTVSNTRETGNDYKIRITSVATNSISDFSDNPFTISSSGTVSDKITVTSPNGMGENWKKGDIKRITWEDEIYDNVRIDLLKAGQQSETLEASTLSDGDWGWHIKDHIETGDQYQIKITSVYDAKIFDKSDGYFTISDADYVEVTSPAGGDNWPQGSTKIISWDGNISGLVKIELYQSLSLEKELTVLPVENKSYSWDIPAEIQNGARYRIKITCVSNTEVSTYSQHFTISDAPNISISNPDAGYRWEMGSIRNIGWSDNVTENVSIELLKGGNLLQPAIASTVPSPSIGYQHYAWKLPTNLNPDSDYQIKVTSTLNSNLTAMSNNFTILPEVANNPPRVNDDYATTQEGTVVTIPVLGNDSDYEGDPISVISITQGTNGSAAISGEGVVVTYAPIAGFLGTDNFTYTASDEKGGTATANVYVTVIPVAAPGGEWAKQAGGSGEDLGYGITVDEDGNTYITGSFKGTAVFGSEVLTSVSHSDLFVAKYDNSGKLVWILQAGGSDPNGESGFDIDVENNGNVYVIGNYRGTATFGSKSVTSAGSSDIFLAKYDASGIEQWVVSAGGAEASDEYGHGVAIDKAGDVIITGGFNGIAKFSSITLTSAGNDDIFIAKYNSSGDIQWVEQAGSVSYDSGWDLAVDELNNIYVTGNFQKYVTFGTGGNAIALESNDGSKDIFLAKYNASGILQWAKQAGGQGSDYSYGLVLDASDNPIITGEFSQTAFFGNEPSIVTLHHTTGTDAFVAKYNNLGDLIWAQSFSGPDAEKGNGVAVDDDNNVLVGGYFHEQAKFGGGTSAIILKSYGTSDLFVAKYSSDGGIMEVRQGGGEETDYGAVEDIVIDGSGNAYITGYFMGKMDLGKGVPRLTSMGDRDILVAKLKLGGTAPQNEPPTAVDDAAKTQMDVPVTIEVLENDSDPEGHPLNIISVTQRQGIVTIDPDATSLTYTPASGMSGCDNFAYTVSDGCGNIGTAKVNVMIIDNSQLGLKFSRADHDGGSDDDEGYQIAFDQSENIYVAGYFRGSSKFGTENSTKTLNSSGGKDAFIAKYNSSGMLQWAHKGGGTGEEIAYGLAIDGSGNAYITGYFGGTATFYGNGTSRNISSNGDDDIFIAKYDPSGAVKWATKAGGPYTDFGKAVEADGSGSVYITGFFYLSADFGAGKIITSREREIFLAKYNSDGVVQWAIPAAGGKDGDGQTVAVDHENLVYVGGTNSRKLAQYNSSGSLQWSIDLGPSVKDIVIDNFNNLFVTGWSQLSKYNSSGSLLWSVPIGAFGDAIALDNSGNAYITGGFTNKLIFGEGLNEVELTSIGGSDIFAAKFSSSGDFLAAKRAGGVGDDWGRDLAVDASGNVHLTGYFQGNVSLQGDPNPIVLNSNGGIDVLIGVTTVDPGSSNNNPPIANIDQIETNAGLSVTIPVLDNDIEPDGESIWVVWVSQSENALVYIGSNSKTVVYKANIDFTGNDEFTYTVSDLAGKTSVGTVLVTVDAAIITQDIIIKPNKLNMLSFNILPPNKMIADLFSDLENLLVAKDDAGKFYIPPYKVNTIGEIDITKGYQVYIKGDTEDWVSNEGTALVPTDLSLSLSNTKLFTIGYPYQNPHPVTDVFASIASSVIVVQDDAGHFWIPMYFVNTLGEMQPGKGYQIYVKEPVKFVYPELSPNLAKKTTSVVTHRTPAHFKFEVTGAPFGVVVTGSETDLSDGDEVGVFAGDLCVGAAVFEEEYPFVIPAWEGDVQYELTGFTEGQPITIKVWQAADHTEFDVVEHFGQPTSGLFQQNPISALTLGAREASEKIPTAFGLDQNFPNPFNPKTVIQYHIPKTCTVTLEIYNVNGELVKTLVSSARKPGSYQAEWDGSNSAGLEVASGLYFCRMKAGNFKSLKKLTLIK